MRWVVDTENLLVGPYWPEVVVYQKIWQMLNGANCAVFDSFQEFALSCQVGNSYFRQCFCVTL